MFKTHFMTSLINKRSAACETLVYIYVGRVTSDESLFKGNINDDNRITDAYYCACSEEDPQNPKIDCSVTESLNDVCVDGTTIDYER